MGRVLVSLALGVLAACAARQNDAEVGPAPAAPPRADEFIAPGPRVVAGTCFEWADNGRDAATENVSTSARPPSVPPPDGPVMGQGGMVGRPARRPVRLPRVKQGKHRVRGSLDIQIVRRVIRRGLPRIRHCYEKQLLRNPNLAGKLNTRFTIGANGNVVNATVTGLHPAVAKCVERALRAMKFPKPPGGGLVIVSYPFMFQPGSGSAPPDPPTSVLAPVGSTPASGRGEERRCVAADMPAALAERAAALGDCFPPGYRHSDRWTAIFSFAQPGTVAEVELRGLDINETAHCLRQNLGDVRFPPPADIPWGDRKVACSFVFENPSAPAVVTRAKEVRASMSQVTYQGHPVAETYSIQRDTSASWRIPVLASLLGPSQGQRLVIEAHPAVDAVVIERVARTAVATGHGELGFAREVGTTGSWIVVNPLATPDWHCSGARAAVAVRVTQEAIEVRAAGSVERIPVGDGAQVFAPYRAALDRLRAAPETRARLDLDLSVARGVEYRVLLRVLEVAVEAGFFDARVIAWAPAEP